MNKFYLITLTAGISLALVGAQVGFAASKTKKQATKPQAQQQSAAPEASEPMPSQKVTHKKSFDRPYGLAGCGLGSVLIGKKGGQIFAATTNGTSLNQLFGISFGTLNCADSSDEEVAVRMDHFVIANKLALASDIARGSGETLDSLSSIMGCSDVVSFSKKLQQSYGAIYPNDSVHANEVTDSIISVVKDDPALLNSCSNVSQKTQA